MEDTSAQLKNRIVVWVRVQIGKKIGDGECWTLVEEALSSNGGKTSSDLGPVSRNANYIWGNKIAIDAVSAGDILQFRNHKETTTTLLEYTFKDEATWSETQTEIVEKPHHTAVVNGTVNAKGLLKTLDQNVKPLGKIVQNQEIYTKNVSAVVTNTTESQKHPYNKKMEKAKVKKTVTISVSGNIWAYRPIIK
ncbi:MAG: hypothetical protein JKY67_06400 [Pseudomonadales bacterium]|nr:hypothetical protein [Pseudomonadales bacterium]